MKNKNNSLKKMYFWNTIGGIANAAFSPLIVMIITRITGAYDAGIFTLGFANAMLLQHVGSFDSRSYQCTEKTNRLFFSDYLSCRLITCGIMEVAVCIFIALNHYTWDKALMTFLLGLLCIGNNVSDIFQGNAQKNDRLDLAGQSLTIKTVLIAIIFGIILIFSNNIYLATGIMALSSFLWVVVFDLPVNQKCFEAVSLKTNVRNIKHILFATFPLFLSLFFQVFIYNMPKYAIDQYMSVESQTIYGILFMPASIINLLGNFIFRPILVSLSNMWNNKHYKKVFLVSVKRIGVLICATIVVAVVGYWIGTPVLSLVYAVDVSDFGIELVLILLGGGFTGVSTLLYFLATVVGKQHLMVLCYIFTFILSVVLAFPFVRNFGMIGAAVCYLISSIVLNIAVTFLIIVTTRRKIQEDI